MKPIAGVELSEKRIRAVTISRVMHRPLRHFDIPWNPASPEAAVDLLRSHLGVVAAVGIAVGFDFLHPKRVKLPPVTAREKARMVALEPERFFPVSSAIVVAAADDSDLIFAADAAYTERFVAALAQWAEVQNIEPAPVAFARAARKAGLADALYSVSPPGGEQGENLVEVSRGRVMSARRAAQRTANAGAREVPERNGIPGDFMAAYGAAIGVHATPDEMLVSNATHKRLSANRMRSVALAATAAAAAIVFALYSASHARDRLQDRIDTELQALAPRAAAAEALQGRISSLGAASAAARVAQGGMDPLAVLATLGKRLPRDVVVMSVRAAGDEWQITGTAKDASAIIPALDADSSIADVRFLSGTSRFTEGRRTYETFSIGFRARPSI